MLICTFDLLPFDQSLIPQRHFKHVTQPSSLDEGLSSDPVQSLGSVMKVGAKVSSFDYFHQNKTI